MTDMQVKYANYLLEKDKLDEAIRKRQGEEIQRDLENSARYGNYKYTMMTPEANRSMGNLGQDKSSYNLLPGTSRESQGPNTWRHFGTVGETVGGIIESIFPFVKLLG